jgi:hypothetical protein
VQNGIRITGIILISLLYCYATGRVNAYSGSWIPQKDFTSDQEFFSTENSVSKFYHVSQTKISFNTLNNNLPSPDEKQFSEFCCIIKFKERFLFNKLTRILFHESGIFIFFPKTDIIFPFHYFW